MKRWIIEEEYEIDIEVVWLNLFLHKYITVFYGGFYVFNNPNRYFEF